MSILKKRFGPSARYCAAGLFLMARLGWIGVVVYAPALTLSTVTGIPLFSALLLISLLATGYTVLGGMMAVLWTDVIQFIILIGGAVCIACTLIHQVPDGIEGILRTAQEAGHLKLFDSGWSLYHMTAPIVAISFFLQLLQDYGTDQVTVQRLMAIKSPRGVSKAICFNAGTDFISIALLLFIGLGLLAYYQQHPTLLSSDLSADQILPFYIIHALPAGVSGLLLTAIFAAAMSSIDSGMHSMTTVLIHDFIYPLKPHWIAPEKSVAFARWITLSLGVFALFMALIAAKIGDVIASFATFMSLFNAPVLALFLLGIFTRRTAFTGWIIGVLIALPFTLWIQYQEIHWVYYFPTSFCITMGIAYGVSTLLKTAPFPP